MHVVGGRHRLLRRLPGGLEVGLRKPRAFEERLGLGQADRPGGDAAGRDRDIRGAAVRRRADDGADRRDRIVAVAAGDLVERRAGACRRAPGNAPRRSISPGFRDVVMWNWKKSSAAIVRRPSGPSATTLPPVSTSTIGISAAASAWQRLPTTVPRLRIGMCATCAIASRISGLARWTASLSSSSRWRVIALTTILPSSIDDAGQAGDVLDVDETGRAGEAEVHRRDQALAAGEHHRAGIGGEQRDRLARPIVGALYSKSGGFIRSDPAAPWPIIRLERHRPTFRIHIVDSVFQITIPAFRPAVNR